MADDSSERTEEPTAQRLKKAREDGQIARSQELAPAAMMVIATLFFTIFTFTWLPIVAPVASLIASLRRMSMRTEA